MYLHRRAEEVKVHVFLYFHQSQEIKLSNILRKVTKTNCVIYFMVQGSLLFPRLHTSTPFKKIWTAQVSLTTTDNSIHIKSSFLITLQTAVAFLSIFYHYFQGYCSSELAKYIISLYSLVLAAQDFLLPLISTSTLSASLIQELISRVA